MIRRHSPAFRPHRFWLVAALCLGPWIPALAAAASLDRETTEALRWQLALERECFSPGLIDGRAGAKTTLALTEFQRSRNIPVTGRRDEATAAALRLDPADDVLASHTVTAADLRLVTGPPPKKWEAKSRAKTLGYESAADALAERFHCSRALLSRLNPGVNLARLSPGIVINVPDIPDAKSPAAGRLEINQSQKVIRIFDSRGRVVGLFHCSIAADQAKRPRGEARVVAVAEDPAYTFDPKSWPEVKDVKRKLLIPPGPRNPVGRCWIALSFRGYGIHGTPAPENIGKTGSHGCIRLTNWDATRLGRMVSAGIPVKFTTTPTPVAVAAN